MPQFRKKPIVIEAWQWDGCSTWDARPIWLRDVHVDHFEQTIIIETLEGDTTASKGDWIIRGIRGELYPCKPDIFDATYEAV